MKALAIGFDQDEFDNLKKLIENSIAKNDLFIMQRDLDLVEILTSEGPFSYIVVNLDEKHYSTPELHEKIIDVIGLRPFIFIGTGNAIKSQLTNELINNVRLNHVLETPVIPNEFKKAQAHAMAWIKNEEFEQSVQEFTREDMRPLRVKSFFMFDQLPYDVYIELTPNKFGKIISKNKFYSHQLLHSYSKKNIKFFYIKKNEHLKTLEASIKNFIQIYKSKHIERNKIVKAHLRTIFFIQEYIRSLTVTDEINELTSLLAGSISDFITNTKDITSILMEIENLNRISFHESSLISAYVSLIIVAEMQWNADMTKERLIVASILQDIYLQNDDLIQIRSLNDPLLQTFSEEDINQFSIHPIKAQEIARLFQGYVELDFLLKDHHEHPTGDGFPAGSNTSQLTTISCIFILATYFSAKIAKLKTDQPNFKEIVSSIKKIYNIGNFKDPVKALTKVF